MIIINKQPKKIHVMQVMLIKSNLRAHDADAAFSLWISQALHPSSTLIKGGKSGAQISRVSAVCR